MSAHLHHFGIAVADLDESVRFYCEGLGFEVFADEHFARDWSRLVGSPCSEMHAVLLANPADPTAVSVELIEFPDGAARAARSGPPNGLFLLAFMTDAAAARERLTRLGYGQFEFEQQEHEGVLLDITFVRDPDGTVIELVCPAAA